MSSGGVRWVAVAIDCAEAAPLAHFYEQLLGFQIVDVDPPDWAQLRSADGTVHLNIQGEAGYEPPTWPDEPGRQAKMMHFEIEVDDLDQAVSAALAAGGRQAAWQPPDRDATRIRVMLDPAGHPFCLFVSGE